MTACLLAFPVRFAVPILLLLSTLALPAATPRMGVWAIGDSVRVDPLSGKAFEENRLLFPDGLTGDYKNSNLVWNGHERRVSLMSARNETVAFQLVIERLDEKPLSDINVKVGELVGPGGVRIPEQNVELFKEWYVNVTKRSAQDYSLGTGWYADALMPCLRWVGNLYPKSFVLPFAIPDLLNNISMQQANHAFWFEVYVPKDRQKAPPGNYRSAITVSSEAGTIDLNLDLHVWDFMLPEETHLGGDIHTDTDLHKLPPDLELKYYQMIRKHRLVMGAIGYTPDISVSGTDVKLDWAKYDDRLSRYLDGTAFTSKYGYDGPGYGVPIELLVLPFDVFPVNLYYTSRNVGWPYGKEWKFYRPWPIDLPKQGITPEYTEVWKKTFRAFHDHFGEKKWDRTKPIVFLLSLDESYDKPSVDKLIYYGNLIKEAGADRLKYRVDGSYPMATMDQMAKVVDIAILGVRSYVPARVSQLRQKGVDDWFYTGMGNLDGDPLGCRALGWVSWKYGAKSWAIWEMDFNSLRAWQYPETYVERNGEVQNGVALLVYRGEAMGLDEPVASMRLKMMRRGNQDYEYFWLLSHKTGGMQLASKIVNSIIHEPLGTNGAWGSPAMWNHNPQDWDRARIQMGDLIEKLQ